MNNNKFELQESSFLHDPDSDNLFDVRPGFNSDFKERCRNRVLAEVIALGYPAIENNGSIHITMPDNRILIYYPQAHKWRIQGKGTCYKCKSVHGAIKTYTKNMK